MELHASSFSINRSSLKFKKHTEPGAMATSFSSTNQITTVKNLEAIETQLSHFIQNSQQHCYPPRPLVKHSVVNL